MVMTVCGRTRFCATDSARMRTTCGAARASSGLAGGSSPGRPVRLAAANRRERPSGSDCGWAAVSVSVLCFMPYRAASIIVMLSTTLRQDYFVPVFQYSVTTKVLRVPLFNSDT